MLKKINFSFALQKLSIVALCFVFAVFSFSCKSSENDPSESIIGKWEMVAIGATENTISEPPFDYCWEFRSDETVHLFKPGPVWIGNIYYPDGKYTSIGLYEIDKGFLIMIKYYDDGDYSEERWKYNLKRDQLKLTREPLYVPGPAEIFIANYLIFKLVEK